MNDSINLKHEYALSVDGNSVKNFISLKIKQNIHGHHHFELLLGSLDLYHSMGHSGFWDVGLEPQMDACKKCIGSPFKAEFSSSDIEDVNGNVFSGIITNISFQRSYGSRMEILVSGYSPTILLDKGIACCSYENMSLAEIFNKVLGRYNIGKKSIRPNFKKIIPYVVQYKETDFNFLSRMAQRYGEWFFYDGEEFHLGTPQKGNPNKLLMGSNFPSFNFSLNIDALKFENRHYNYLENEVYKSKSNGSVSNLGDFGDTVLSGSKKVFKEQPVIPLDFFATDQKVLDEAVSNQLEMQASDLIHFKGNCHNPDLIPGGIISAKGSAPTLELDQDEQYGEYIIIQVTHHLDINGVYENSFNAIPSGVDIPPPNSHIHTVQCEPQVAVVKENVKDPDGMGRVRVNFHWQQNIDRSPWLRIITPHAGNNKGMYFIPEKDEEVMVGFVNGDPERPFIHGSLYHGKNTPKDFKEGGNLIKAIRTKSGNEIQFYDEKGKEAIKIFNREQNEIILTLDENGKITIRTDNLLEMFAKDITMDATNDFKIKVGNNMDIQVDKDMNTKVKGNKEDTISKNYKIKVTQNHSVDAKQKLTYKAGTDSKWSAGKNASFSANMNMKLKANMNMDMAGKMGVKMKGMKVDVTADMTAKVTANMTMDIKANMKLSMQGGMKADLKGGMNVGINGATVMIN